MKGKDLFLNFSQKSPRAYRGDVQWSGGGRRGKEGRYVPTGIDRKRWTTALAEPALDQLHHMAKQAGVNRCVVVEALLLHPQCRALAMAAITGAKQPAAAAPPTTKSKSKLNRAKSKEGMPTLGEAVADLCDRNGSAWPRGMGTRLAERYGVTKQSVAQRKKEELRRRGVS